MPLPLDEIERRLGQFLLTSWLSRIGWSEEQWRSMYAHGVPVDWARTIAEITEGTVSIDDWPLLIHAPNRAIDGYVNQAQVAEVQKARRYGRPPKSKHPFTLALRAKGLTVKEWAKSKGLTRERVNSWMLEGAGGRAIPEEWADAIGREFRVPRNAWKNGVRG